MHVNEPYSSLRDLRCRLSLGDFSQQRRYKIQPDKSVVMSGENDGKKWYSTVAG